jgi:hypothetical protein
MEKEIKNTETKLMRLIGNITSFSSLIIININLLLILIYLFRSELGNYNNINILLLNIIIYILSKSIINLCDRIDNKIKENF